MKEYLNVAVSVKGNIFYHPGPKTKYAFMSKQIHEWAKTTGNYPYQHLYEGDNVQDIIDEMQLEVLS